MVHSQKGLFCLSTKKHTICCIKLNYNLLYIVARLTLKPFCGRTIKLIKNLIQKTDNHIICLYINQILGK